LMACQACKSEAPPSRISTERCRLFKNIWYVPVPIWSRDYTHLCILVTWIIFWIHLYRFFASLIWVLDFSPSVKVSYLKLHMHIACKQDLENLLIKQVCGKKWFMFTNFLNSYLPLLITVCRKKKINYTHWLYWPDYHNTSYCYPQENLLELNFVPCRTLLIIILHNARKGWL
jgi:hypothetical protein